MNIIYYDHQFNTNEWFILILLIAGYSAVFVLPRRFNRKLSVLFVLFGIFMGLLMDHTISIEPFDFYDVNDNSSYQISDFFTYVMYGPFSYLFIYFYDRWKAAAKYAPFYILVWAIFGLGMESLGVALDVYHYKKGYQVFYSFPFYIVTQSMLLVFYYVMLKQRSD